MKNRRDGFVNCCENCFTNLYIQEYIKDNGNVGNCDYCCSKHCAVISIDRIGAYFRECFDKAYESLDDGTGAYYDPEEKDYCGPNGHSVDRLSVIDILLEEGALDNIDSDLLIEDIMDASGPSFRDLKHGGVDRYDDIHAPCYVLKDDLYGVYGTKLYHTWDHFKFLVKHYNRFFDVDGYPNGIDTRKQLLDTLRPLIMEYMKVVPKDTKFYRARKRDSDIDFDTFIINKELSPAPPKYAQANRMSPAGISYLYVSSDCETACKECRYLDEEIMIAEYRTNTEMQIIDFSEKSDIPISSIFSEDYEHDTHWFSHFLNLFVEEISKPIDNCMSKDRSYEYVATQFLAEYIRSLGFDGIGFNSSVNEGKSYCFFCGPDIEYCKSEYGIYDITEYQLLPSFLDWFDINSVSLFFVAETSELKDLNQKRINKKE